MSDLYNIFSNNLKKYCNMKKIKPADIARLLDVSTATTTRWFNGINFPTVERIIKICEYLDCSINDLFDDGKGEYSDEEKDIINKFRNNEKYRNAIKALTELNK